MRIVVNDIVAVPESGGVFSILEDFYNKIINQQDKNEWIFLLSDKYFFETKNVKIMVFPEIKKNWFKRIQFELYTGKNVIKNLKPDVYLSLQNTMTLGLQNCRCITYVHQPLFYQKNITFSFLKKSERNLAIHQRLIGRFINYTLKKTKPEIVVQTNWMKEALVAQKVSIDKRVHVIPPQLDLSFSKSVPELNHSFFYPSIIRPYKNHSLIIKAIKSLSKQNDNFVVKITGNSNELSFIHGAIPKQIDFTGIINREKVFEEYKKSVLIFPSLMETYGLPLMEAKLSGTLIFAADLNYAHEVLGEYPNAYYFNPYKEEELSNLMLKFLNGDLKIKRINSLDIKHSNNDLYHFVTAVFK